MEEYCKYWPKELKEFQPGSSVKMKSFPCAYGVLFSESHNSGVASGVAYVLYVSSKMRGKKMAYLPEVDSFKIIRLLLTEKKYNL